MDSPLVKIDSFELYKPWVAGHGFREDPWIPENVSMTNGIWPYAYFDQNSIPEGFPNGADNFFYGRATTENYWVCREFVRAMKGEYRIPLFFPELKRLLMQATGCCSKYWWHAAHVSLSDPSKLAFTPNHEYGKRDRQVVMNIGRYLKKFYGEHLNDDQIRNLANVGKDKKLLWAYGVDDIMRVYNEGPQSCMKGKDAVQAYAYKYPEAEGGDLEFGLAHLANAEGGITARALVSLRHKVFPRYYGDEGPILDSMLQDSGFKKVDSMEGFPTRLLHLPYESRDDAILMPYLDGDNKQIWGPEKDPAGVRYWQWGGTQPEGTEDRWAENADGILWSSDPEDGDEEDDDYRTCDHCGESHHEDTMSHSEFHGMEICESCTDRHYVNAYYGSHNEMTLVRSDEVVWCQSDDEYYVDRKRVLEYHNIVQVEDGDYYARSDTMLLTSGERYQEDDDELDDVVPAGTSSQSGETVYCPRCDIDEDWIGVTCLSGFEWFHPDYAPSGQTIKEWLAAGAIDDIKALICDDDKVDEWLDEITAPAVPAPQVQFTEMA